MDKADAKSDTSSVINMKEYAASEYPASEPPPAYIKPRSNGLRIARLAAFTVIASSIILGAFILSAAWIQANTARNLDLTLNQELLDDLHPSYEHLVANEVLQEQQQNNAKGAEIDKPKDNEEVSVPKEEEEVDKAQNSVNSVESSQEEKQSLELDEIANMLMQRNLRGNVNCIVEKRRNEELVDHAPRALNLPFGLNITTPPRLQHLTGEQMVIICKDDEDEKSEEKEDPIQNLIFPAPQQILSQIQQIPQIIPLSQIIQHLPQQQQQQVFVPQQQQQQVFVPQQQQQQVFVPQQQQQQVFVPQQPIFYQPQMVQPQPQQQQQVFVPPMLQQRPPMPIREVPMSREGVPMNHVQHFRVPINPLAVNEVPVNQMPLTHMPMRANPEVADEGVPVHHLVPPRPQILQPENFQNVEEQPRLPSPMFQQRFPTVPPQQLQMARARVLPLEVREPRLMRNPLFPLMGGENERPLPPARRIRFPDGDSEEVTLTKIIPIRMVKEEVSSEEEENKIEEKRPFPIPINAILNMILGSLRPLAPRDGPMPIPIDIKIERIEKPMDTNTGRPIIESDEEEDEDEEKDEASAPINNSNQNFQNSEEEDKEKTPATVQQVEIVDKPAEDTRALPIPADAQDPQIFRIDDKTDNNWPERAFLPNGQGRGARVFQLPPTQIFPVSDNRQGRVMNGPVEGETNLFPVPIQADEANRSVRLFPVQDSVQVEENKGEGAVAPAEPAVADPNRPHYVQPRSV